MGSSPKPRSGATAPLRGRSCGHRGGGRGRRAPSANGSRAVFGCLCGSRAGPGAMGTPPLMARPPAHGVANWNAFGSVASFAVLTLVAGCALLRCGVPIAPGPGSAGRSVDSPRPPGVELATLYVRGCSMRCAGCQHENPAQAKFCQECGASLAVSCASCGAELPPTAKFCHGCGQPQSADRAVPPSPDRAPRDYTPRHLAEKILRSKSALEGESPPSKASASR
jgi:hypothetical protein